MGIQSDPARGYFVAGPGFVGFMDCGNIEERWILSMVEQCQDEAEEARRIDEPMIMMDCCDDCGARLHEDTPGVLECANGHKFRDGVYDD